MADQSSIRHWVALAGRIIDQQSKQPIAGATVTLSEGPPAFQSAVAIRQQELAWVQSKERLNQTISRDGGLFHFLDLPAGGPYKLTVTVPHQLARYGTQPHPDVIDVAPMPAAVGNRVVYPWVEVALVSTGVTGQVTTMIGGAPAPVVRARVSIQDAQTVTDANGAFALYGLIGARKAAQLAPAKPAAPKPRLEVKAAGFAPATLEVDLLAGSVLAEPLQINLTAL